MIETWILIFWLSDCVGIGCPIENWIATEQPSRVECESRLRAWKKIDEIAKTNNHEGICLFGILTDMEPPDD